MLTRPAKYGWNKKLLMNFGGLAIMVTQVTLDPWLCVAGFRRLCGIGCLYDVIVRYSCPNVLITFVMTFYRINNR